jgi:hypothetical protein
MLDLHDARLPKPTTWAQQRILLRDRKSNRTRRDHDGSLALVNARFP